MVDRTDIRGGRGYDIWGDMGIGSPHKVYLESTKKPQTLVSNMWRTIKRREEKLNREVISEYYDFDIVFVERY